MLEIQAVNRSFGKKRALKSVDLEISNGIYGLLGENGAGKSTLMKILATLDKPSSGKVLFCEKDIWNNQDYLSQIGYMPQDIEIYDGFTAYDYLEYIALLKGMKKKGLKGRIYEILEFVNLKDVDKKKIKTFSGGMKRRIGIGQAIINNPKILILDEPTAGLDPYERIRFSNIITNMSEDKIILFSTHIVSDIEAITDQVVILSEGMVKNKGKIQDMVLELQGKVKQVEVTNKELQDFTEETFVVRIKNQGDKYMVRFIEKEGSPKSGNILTANLEDYFVYIGGLKNEKN